MKLTRVYPNDEGKISFPPNSYGQENGEWFVRIPGCHLGSVKNHQVTEHEDGTITVSPSILHHDFKIVDGEKVEFQAHGYLERGEWRDC